MSVLPTTLQNSSKLILGLSWDYLGDISSDFNDNLGVYVSAADHLAKLIVALPLKLKSFHVPYHP